MRICLLFHCDTLIAVLKTGSYKKIICSFH